MYCIKTASNLNITSKTGLDNIDFEYFDKRCTNKTEGHCKRLWNDIHSAIFTRIEHLKIVGVIIGRTLYPDARKTQIATVGVNIDYAQEEEFHN